MSSSPTAAEQQLLAAEGLEAEPATVGWGLWNLNDAQLALVPRLPTLRALVLFETCESREVTPAGLAALAGHPSLVQLDLGPGIREAGVERAAAVPGLLRLRLDSAGDVGDAAMKHVARLTRLEELSLQYTSVGDDGVAQLAGLTRLRRLELEGTRVTDAVMRHLGGMRGLELLTLGNPMPPALLALMGGSKSGLTDAVLGALPGFPALTELRVGGSFTAGGLGALQSLPNLTSLTLTAPLADGAVGPLSALRGLKQLYGLQHRMSATAVEALKRALPGCAVTA